MSKGGETVSTTSIDPDIKRAFLANFEQARNVAGSLPVQQFAGFSPLYQAGEEAAVNAALGGPGIAGTDLAAQMAAMGSTYQPMQQQAVQAQTGLDPREHQLHEIACQREGQHAGQIEDDAAAARGFPMRERGAVGVEGGILV